MSTFVTKHAKDNGLRKKDGRSPMKIEVKAIDIRNATQKNSKCCAFARAAKRSDPTIKAAYFFRTAAWVEYADKIVRYLLPPSVQKEIVSFDRSKRMDPGTYQLYPPQSSHRMSEVKKRGKKRPGRHKPGNGTISRRVRHTTTSVRTLQEPSDPK